MNKYIADFFYKNYIFMPRFEEKHIYSAFLIPENPGNIINQFSESEPEPVPGLTVEQNFGSS